MTNHPAKFTPAILWAITNILGEEVADLNPFSYDVLDVFAGVGGVHDLSTDVITTTGVELEPEWANARNDTIVGDATALPFCDESFDCICTSPTFANRMADSHEAKDESKRITYTHVLGRKLSENNSGAMGWGVAYRRLHIAAWAEAMRVLKPGGLFIIDIKNHIKGGKIQRVTEWHLECLIELGLFVEQVIKVPVTGMGFGANRDARVPYESILVLRKPS